MTYNPETIKEYYNSEFIDKGTSIVIDNNSPTVVLDDVARGLIVKGYNTYILKRGSSGYALRFADFEVGDVIRFVWESVTGNGIIGFDADLTAAGSTNSASPLAISYSGSSALGSYMSIVKISTGWIVLDQAGTFVYND